MVVASTGADATALAVPTVVASAEEVTREAVATAVVMAATAVLAARRAATVGERVAVARGGVMVEDMEVAGKGVAATAVVATVLDTTAVADRVEEGKEAAAGTVGKGAPPAAPLAASLEASLEVPQEEMVGTVGCLVVCGVPGKM